MSAAPAYLTPWKKGQSGNPGGRPKLPPELRAIKALSVEEINRLVSKYARMAPQDVSALVDAGAIPMLELCIARIFQESAAKGDNMRLSFLLDRAVGKVKEVVQDEDDESWREIQELTDQELVKLVKERLPALENAG